MNSWINAVWNNKAADHLSYLRGLLEQQQTFFSSLNQESIWIRTPIPNDRPLVTFQLLHRCCRGSHMFMSPDNIYLYETPGEMNTLPGRHVAMVTDNTCLYSNSACRHGNRQLLLVDSDTEKSLCGGLLDIRDNDVIRMTSHVCVFTFNWVLNQTDERTSDSSRPHTQPVVSTCSNVSGTRGSVTPHLHCNVHPV